MITGRNRFNIYLLLILVALAPGCRSTKDDKDKRFATIRIHLEAVPNAMDFSTSVPIYRAKPVSVTVDKSPFLTEANVSGASVVDAPGGFALEIKFDRRGTWLLEETTTTNPGRHFAIFSEFGKKPKQSRWLGAPIVTRRISNGTLTFAPDATREEAEEIARGLTNLAKEIERKSKW